MTRYNLCFVLNKEKTHLLMGFRSKDPYKGKYNLLGGKIEDNEDDLDSAYRELFEESGISSENIILKPFLDFNWHAFDMEMKVYIGALTKEVTLKKEIHELHWIPITDNFFDLEKYAGEGNIGHMVEIYKQMRTDYIG